MTEPRERSSYANQIHMRYAADQARIQAGLVTQIERWQLFVLRLVERAMEIEEVPEDVRKRVINRVLLGRSETEVSDEEVGISPNPDTERPDYDLQQNDGISDT